MVAYKRLYLDYFSYGEQDFVPCENCGGRCIDVHHLDGRGPGMDVIENLMGLCRDCHDEAGANPVFNKKLKEKHLSYINYGV